MKKILIGALIAFIILSLLSYKTTENTSVIGNTRILYNVPIKQTDVIVTDDYKRVKKLIKLGYICQDVDITFNDSGNDRYQYYTMIKN